MNPARHAVVKVLTRQAAAVRSMPPLTVDAAKLDPRDRRLAVAIHRTVLQRWLTLECLLDSRLSKPLRTLEPTLQAVLLSGAAQLVFMDKVPAHAAVDESVAIATNRLRRGAGSLANAVLRRVAELVADRVPSVPWAPSPDRIPLERGHLRLAAPVLPPLDRFADHLAAATSHPAELVECWRSRFGDQTTRDLLLHDLANPPTLVYAPDAPGIAADPAALAAVAAEPHDSPGFLVWSADHASLAAFLAADPQRRVQDPASAAPVAATASLSPALIADVCAGRGTKTRQLAALHPSARIVATDIDDARRTDLRAAFADSDRVAVVEPYDLTAYTGRCDLVVLDVPCSNTAVLARRPEARYRYHAHTLDSLVALQRTITEQAAPLLAPTGRLLYATCSIEPAENDDQADWIAAHLARSIASRRLILPSAPARSYHDGSYHALIA